MSNSSSEDTQLEPGAETRSNSSSSNLESRRKNYPARFKNLDRVRGFVGQAADDSGLGPDAQYQVQLAVDEAFSNIVEHAYGGESDEEIEVTCILADDGLTIKLRDCGVVFNPKDVPDPDLEAELHERQIGGLGLYFIRQLMDEVEFTFDKDVPGQHGCNLLKMVKFKETKD